MDKKAAMKRIAELTKSESWQEDKEAASEVMRLGRAMWADKSNKPRPRKIAIWHDDKLLVTGTAEQLSEITGLSKNIIWDRAGCGYTDVKKRTFRYVEEK
ncbi:hypothetical protein [Enterococcus faecium]|uniref:hypothetical protein n=1 Tax=Enterococcus faecium TaxID=1352 RepID=UPI00321AD0E8|nr:hypothetical protein [Enterococcus faecium]